MSSGHGLMTKKGRCFPFWEEFMRCHETTHYPVHQCRNQMEDYVECLHQRKERERLVRIITEIRRKRDLRDGAAENASQPKP